MAFIFWDTLKGKIQTTYQNKLYFFELLEFCCGIFKWTVPDGIDPKFLERYLNSCGAFGLTKNDDGEYRVSLGGLEPPFDQYAIGTHWIGDTLGGEHCDGIRGETAAVCWHNSDHLPNLDLVPVAARLTEFDKSISAVTRSSRANPVTIAHDEKTLRAFTDVRDKILDGDIVGILSENVLDDFQNRKSVEMIEFTKPEYNRLLQYLYESKESEYRNFYRKYGQNLQSVPKHAQAIQAEIDGADSVCFIIPRDMLDQRKKFCVEASVIFGDTWGVEFADPWASEEIRYNAETDQKRADADLSESNVEHMDAETEQIIAETDQIADQDGAELSDVDQTDADQADNRTGGDDDVSD